MHQLLLSPTSTPRAFSNQSTPRSARDQRYQQAVALAYADVLNTLHADVASLRAAEQLQLADETDDDPLVLYSKFF